MFGSHMTQQLPLLVCVFVGGWGGGEGALVGPTDLYLFRVSCLCQALEAFLAAHLPLECFANCLMQATSLSRRSVNLRSMEVLESLIVCVVQKGQQPADVPQQQGDDKSKPMPQRMVSWQVGIPPFICSHSNVRSLLHIDSKSKF